MAASVREVSRDVRKRVLGDRVFLVYFFLPRLGTDMTIGIVGPHSIIRKGIAALLVLTPDHDVLFELDSLRDNTNLSGLAQPAVLLVCEEGIGQTRDALSRFSAIFPASRLLLLCDSVTLEVEVGFIKAGAWGCISKDAEPQLLYRALSTVARGEIWVSSRAATYLIVNHAQAQSADQDEPQELTSREREILALVASGLRNKEIAGYLRSSENTVKVHLRTVFRKLNVSSRIEATLFYLRTLSQQPLAASQPQNTPEPAETRIKTRKIEV